LFNAVTETVKDKVGLPPKQQHQMKKLIINTMTVLAIAASTASAKMYYFKTFEADFAYQPVVKKSVTNSGSPYVSYQIGYDDGAFGIVVYEPVVSISAHQAYQIDYATKDSLGRKSSNVEHHSGEFNGYPFFALKYMTTLKSGQPALYLKCWIYTESHVFMVDLLTDPKNAVIADHYMADFLGTLKFKAVAPEVRPAIPVANNATEGEI
jgi:hypothetical protein